MGDERLKNLARHSWLHPSYIQLRVLNAEIERFAGLARGRLLDVGCGRKPYERLIRPYVDAYIGLDMPSSLYGNPHTDVLGSALALPFASASVQTVLAVEVLEHLPDTALAIAELHRVLAQGGALFLTAPLNEPLHEAPHDYFRFTRYGLEFILGRGGFAVQGIRPRGGRWAGVGYRISRGLAGVFGLPGADFTSSLAALALPVLLVCALVQIVFAAIDAVIPDETDTLGYIVIAEKA